MAVDNPIEAICCNEIEAAINLVSGEEGTTCLASHSGFVSCCLNRHSIRVAIEMYAQYVGPFDGTIPPNE